MERSGLAAVQALVRVLPSVSRRANEVKLGGVWEFLGSQSLTVTGLGYSTSRFQRRGYDCDPSRFERRDTIANCDERPRYGRVIAEKITA